MDQSMVTRPSWEEKAPVLEMTFAGTHPVTDMEASEREVSFGSEDEVRPLVLLDAHFRIRSANRAFCNLLGLAPNVSNGTLLFDVGNRQWDNATIRGLLAETAETPEPRERSVSLHIHDVGCCLLRLKARRHKRDARSVEFIHLSVEDCVVLTLSDDVDETAREQGERHLAQTLTIIARDLNQSIALILGSAQILSQHQDETVKDDAENIACAGSRVQAVLSALIAQAREIERMGEGSAHAPGDMTKSLGFNSGDTHRITRSTTSEMNRRTLRRSHHFLRVA